VIVDPGNGRPASGLAVSRSFGDPDFKEPLHLVTATPDVIRETLEPADAFVILASDGLVGVPSLISLLYFLPVSFSFLNFEKVCSYSLYVSLYRLPVACYKCSPR
jgi:hypothetical protein